MSAYVDKLASGPPRVVAARLGLVLFVLSAFPLLLVEVPPYQDLPNHLASIHVVEHADKYPEFVFNGHFKTNGALFAWLHLVGKLTGSFVAAKLFAALTLAAAAFVLPWAVCVLTGDARRSVMASLFAWPLVHNWFVSMGMLDYALGVPLSLALLALAKRQLEGPTLRRGLGMAVLGAATWYAHGFALLIAYMLVTIELVRHGKAGVVRGLRALVLPLSPAALLVVASVLLHLFEPKGTMNGHVDIFKALPVWELLYNAWAEWLWAFTRLEFMTLVPTVVLAIYAFRHREDDVPFFSKWAGLVLVVVYLVTPYAATNWFHVNSRFLAYFWFFALLRVPPRLPRGLVALGLVGAVVNAGAMAVDYVRLERDRRDFIAGISAVPEGARLLPLLFRAKGVSENSRSLLHAWGFYVIAKDTSAPLLFAHSRSFPVMYKEPPPDRFNHLVLEGFAPGMKSAAHMCAFLHENNLEPDDCRREYRERWDEMWREALPRFDHVLLWEASDDVRASVPPEYRPVLESGKLVVLARKAP